MHVHAYMPSKLNPSYLLYRKQKPYTIEVYFHIIIELVLTLYRKQLKEAETMY